MADNTKFCPECGKEVAANAVVCTGCGVQLKPIGLGSGKNKMVAALLAFFLGGFGIQWFYLNTQCLYSNDAFITSLRNSYHQRPH